MASRNRAKVEDKPLAGRKICICTPDYPHLVKNGGIGTSFRHTVSMLSQAGATMTVVYANVTDGMTDEALEAVVEAVRKDGAELEYLLPSNAAALLDQFVPNDIFSVSSYLAYQKLKSEEYDVILFPDWRGLSFYSSHAKRMGLAFGNTEIWVQAHSTSLWHELNNQTSGFNEIDVRRFHLERKAVELCDYLLPASQYLLDWMIEHGFRTPARTEVMPLLLDRVQMGAINVPEKRDPITITELVFFGRLERRKGIHFFVEAIDRLRRFHADVFDPHAVRVTFLGKVGNVDDGNAVDFISKALDRAAIPYAILPSMSSEEAVSYLSRPGVLAVMPSITDNSPLTVHECLATGLPFIAARAGGIPEIIHPDDRDALLFEPSSIALETKLAAILRNGQRLGRPAVDQDKNLARWVSRAAADPVVSPAGPRSILPKTASRPSKAAGVPTLSVCLTHYERPAQLKTTLDSLAAQTFQDFEIIIASNGSDTPGARRFLDSLGREYPGLDIQVFHLPDVYAGAARNRSIAKARGEYLVIMDDDNYAHPRQFELFVQAIKTSGYDALSTVAITFSEKDDPKTLERFANVYLPTGSGLSLNLFSNSYGDANGIYRRSAVASVGGFTEDRLSWEDYELFSALETAGFKTGVIPEPLLYLRNTVGSVSRRGSMLPNYYRALRPALRNLPWGTYGDALLVALTASLQRMSDVRFEAPSETADLARLQSGDPLTVSRMLTSHALEHGGYSRALWQIEAIRIATPAIVDLDATSLVFSSEGRRGLERLAGSGSDLAAALLNALDSRDFGELGALIATHNSVDGAYVSGLIDIFQGRPSQGLGIWARMLESVERDYVASHGDLLAEEAADRLPSGIVHYLINGQHEARTFGYVPPPRALFATISRPYPLQYFERIELLNATERREAGQIAAQLIRDVVTSGSVLAAAHLGKLLMGQGDERYARENPDVSLAVQMGELPDLRSHWLQHGHLEAERWHLVEGLSELLSIDGLFRAEGYQTVSAKSDLDDAGLTSLKDSPVRNWLSLS